MIDFSLNFYLNVLHPVSLKRKEVRKPKKLYATTTMISIHKRRCMKQDKKMSHKYMFKIFALIISNV